MSDVESGDEQDSEAESEEGSDEEGSTEGTENPTSVGFDRHDLTLSLSSYTNISQESSRIMFVSW